MPLFFAQQHDRLVGRDLDAHPDQRQADHGASVRPVGHPTTGLPDPPGLAVELRHVGIRGRPRPPSRSPTATNGRLRYRSRDVEAVAEHELVGELDAPVAQVVGNDPPASDGRAARTSRASRSPRRRAGPARYASVRPVSTMSSTSTTSRPPMSVLEVVQDLDPARIGREPRDRDEVDLDGDRRRSRGQDRRRRATRPSARRRARHRRDDPLRSPRRAARRARRRRRRRAGSSRARSALAQSRDGRTAWRSSAVRSGDRDRRARRASRPCAPAPRGLRWRRYGSSTCSNSPASRSANARYMRRWRGSMPCRMNAGRDRARSRARLRRTARGRDCGVLGVTRPYSSSWPSSSSLSSAAWASSARVRLTPGSRPPRGRRDRSSSRTTAVTVARLRSGAAPGASPRTARLLRRSLAGVGAAALGSPSASVSRPAAAAPRRRRATSPVVASLVEPFLDHLQRQEVLALLAQDEAQPFDVGRDRTCGIPTACVPGRRGLGSRGSGSSRS